jgi:nucleotide-binding universal stress UspA family protein
MTRRIVHPSDFSKASGAAFKKAVEMAKAQRAELMIVHVVNPIVPVAGDGYVSPKLYEEIAASTRDWAQKQLDKLVTKAKQAGVRAKPGRRTSA